MDLRSRRDFLPKAVINEFIKNRFNNSLESIGIDKIFEIDESLVAQTDWFDDEIIEPNMETSLSNALLIIVKNPKYNK